MDLAGGDPVMTILPENATVEQQEALRREMGLNDPFLVRVPPATWAVWSPAIWVSPYVTDRDVFLTFMERLPNTLLLGGSALIIACIIAIPWASGQP